MQSRAAVALIPRLAAILRLDRPAADSLSTSRTLRMGNLGSGIPRSYGKERSHADSRITQRRPSSPSTGCRDRPESVVAIRRNAWSSSIGMTGRDQSESLVVISRCAHPSVTEPPRCGLQHDGPPVEAGAGAASRRRYYARMLLHSRLSHRREPAATIISII